MLTLNEEKLNMVTGGTLSETGQDSWVLNKYGHMNDNFTLCDLIAHWFKYSGEVDGGWKKVGITCVSRPLFSNRYVKDGKDISQDLAWCMAGF